MMSPVAMFLLDGLIALLLIATIWYCAVLNQRLNTLRNSNAELHALVRQLNLASQSAERSASALKSAGNEAISELQEQIAQAKELSRDLARDRARDLEGHQPRVQELAEFE